MNPHMCAKFGTNWSIRLVVIPYFGFSDPLCKYNICCEKKHVVNAGHECNWSSPFLTRKDVFVVMKTGD